MDKQRNNAFNSLYWKKFPKKIDMKQPNAWEVQFQAALSMHKLRNKTVGRHGQYSETKVPS